MKAAVFAALFYAVAFAALLGIPGAQAEAATSCDDAPGMEGCIGENTSSSSSAKKNTDAVPWTMELHKTIAFEEGTIFDVDEDSVLVSDDVIDLINMHFVVHHGVTLTFQAPAVKISRDEDFTRPLFELLGTVRFQATGSTPVLLDGSLEDEWDIVQTASENAVFMRGPDNIIRYHQGGVTVSRMEHAGGDLAASRHEEVGISSELKASLAAFHAKAVGKSDVPSSTSSSSSSTSTSSTVPKHVLKVGDTLTGPLISPTGKSAIWAAKHGSITFGQISADPSNESGVQNLGRVLSAVLVASESGPLKRVVQARAVLMKEQLEGRVPVPESGKIPWGWAWVPRRSRLQDDVESARGRIEKLEMEITDRGGVEVSMDGMRVLSRSGRYSREWMNRFPWRRSKNDSYELHVKDDGMEVQLNEKRIWGVTADDIMG